MVRVVIGHLASVIKIIGDFQNDALQLQMVGIFHRYLITSQISTEDISGHCPGGIAVSVMIDGSYQSLIEIIDVLKRTVYGYSEMVDNFTNDVYMFEKTT